MKWAALYSQTGSEICDISDKIGRYPDLVISDNVLGNPKTDNRILNAKKCTFGQYKPLSAQQKINYYNALDSYDIVTLHGWLNIVPEVVCSRYTIYNGHPGLINCFPELKGKDPQIRTWKNIDNYKYIGSVIHKVTPEVDGGEIISYRSTVSTNCVDLESTFSELKKTSLNCWVDFLKDKL